MKKVINCLRFSVVGAAVVLLAACSSMSGHMGNSDNAAQTYGTNNRTEINGVPVQDLIKKTTFHFGFDKDSVDSNDIPAVQAHGIYLASHPDMKVTLRGHTDQRGSREYNIGLGERRNNTVAQILMMNGARASQIKQVSYGQEKPVAFGHSAADYAQNRRVEIVYR